MRSRLSPDDGWRVIHQAPSDGNEPPARLCPNCSQPNPSFDHGVWEAVAMTLAQPLRDALERHLDEHGCGTGDMSDPRYVGGFLHCDAAKQLFDLLPYGDRILLA